MDATLITSRTEADADSGTGASAVTVTLFLVPFLIEVHSPYVASPRSETTPTWNCWPSVTAITFAQPRYRKCAWLAFHARLVVSETDGPVEVTVRLEPPLVLDALTPVKVQPRHARPPPGADDPCPALRSTVSPLLGL